VGQSLQPLCVPWLAIHLGWRSAFLVTGAAGVLWMLVWWLFYREPSEGDGSQQSEGAMVDEESFRALRTTKTSFAQLLATRGAWAYIIGKFLTDPVWWFFFSGCRVSEP